MTVQAFGYTSRCAQSLFARYFSPVLGIHSDCRGLYIESGSQRFGEQVGIYSIEDRGVDRRLNRRNSRIAAAIATDPYSKTMIQPGTSHGRPSVRKCQT